MERKKNEELLKQLRKQMPSRELAMERKRSEDLLKQLHEAKSKLKSLQNADTPSKSTSCKEKDLQNKPIFFSSKSKR